MQRKKMGKWIIIMMAIMMLVSTALGGCGNSESTTPAGETTTPSTDGANSNGDTNKEPMEPQEFHMSLGSEPPALDAQITTDADSFIILNAVQEGLTRVGPDGIAPGVAESWELSSDSTTYTFHLRKDAKWSNGDPITAQSFVDGWERAANATNAAQYYNMITDYIKGAKAYYDFTNYLELKEMYENNRAAYDEAHAQEDGTIPTPDVAAFGEAKSDIQAVSWDSVGVKVIDEYTLQVELIKPTAWWLELTSFATYLPFNKQFYEANMDTYATEVDTLLYNGPFVLKEWLHEQKLTLEKNPNYWDKDSVKLEKITIDVVKDANTRLSLYEAGDLDRAVLDSTQVPLYQDDPTYYTFADMASFYMVFNTTKKPFNNAKVRKALSLGFDRQAYVDTNLNNGSSAAFGLVPDDFAAFSGSTESFREASAKKFGGQLFQENMEEAKKLLAEGLAEEGMDIASFSFDFVNTDSTAAIKSSEFVKSLYKQTLGIDISISNVPFAERLQRQRTQQFDVVLAAWGPDFNDPETWLFLFESDGAYNDGKWSNATYDELVSKAKAAVDPQERLQLFLDAEKILIDEAAIAPVYFRKVAALQQPYAKGIIQKPFGAEFEFKWAYIEGKN